ncbi:MAG: 4Fe-4S binding protein [Candidatus Omnitrophica bacterium]|nr:4Fe-4S binding protein [Candidatus Omnitrophota bacterium]
MPWVDKDKCTGCRICVEKCPVKAISLSAGQAGMEDEKAKINMEECIHCGICHSVCPEEAVRHDSEKIPEVIKANVEMTKKFMELCAKYLGDTKEKNKCLGRMIKHFGKEKLIAERTLEELEKLKNA